jgi:hypothetical protein
MHVQRYSYKINKINHYFIMRAKLVAESLSYLNEMKSIPVGDTRELKEKYTIFKTPLFGIIANELQRIPDNVFVTGKLDIDKFYSHLKRTYGFKYSLSDTKKIILEAAPILKFTDKLKLNKEERSDMKFQEKAYHGELSLEFFNDSEIVAEAAEDDDKVLRSADGSTEPAYYRFDKQLTPHETNMLKVAYVFKYGDPTKTLWQNYLDARPVTVGHINKFGKSFSSTYDVDKSLF